MSLNFADNEEDSDDEWFYSSFQRYDDLLMYDVHGSISCAAFLNSDRLLLASSGGNQNEVWELSIPKKLIAGKDAGLTKNRDFSVITAGFTSGVIKQMLPVDKGFITSESSGINYYTIPQSGDETDIISLKLAVRVKIQDASISIDGSRIYSGSCLSDLANFDLKSESSQNIHVYPSSSESIDTVTETRLSGLDFKSGLLYVGLKDTGDVLIYDPRQDAIVNRCCICESSKSPGGAWTMDVGESGSYIASLSSHGSLQLYDNRNISEPIFSTILNIEKQSENSFCDTLCVRLCSNENLVSVSGFDNSIRIFDFDNNGSNEPVFIHDGHRGENVKNIRTHIWHENQEKLVFSTDNVGQLQAWRFKI